MAAIAWAVKRLIIVRDAAVAEFARIRVFRALLHFPEFLRIRLRMDLPPNQYVHLEAPPSLGRGQADLGPPVGDVQLHLIHSRPCFR
jgi:hypothetical protein